MTARVVSAALLAPAALAALVLGLPGAHNEARAQAPAGPLVVDPHLDIALNANLLGSSPQGASGDPAEAWALPIAAPLRPPVVDGRPLAGTIVLMRYTEAQGWRYVESAANLGGGDYAGGGPVAREQSGRVTPRGGLALVVPASGGPNARTLVVRDRGARPRVVPAPGTGILPEPPPDEPGLATEFLSARALAAADGPGETTIAYVAIEGRARQRAVARFAGGAWAREPICAADASDAAPEPCSADETLHGSAGELSVVAVSAAGSGAWLLARADPNADPGVRRGLVLFERVTTGGGARWRLRDMGAPLFERGDPGQGVTDVRPINSGSALTATDDGVWVDGTFLAQGVPTDVTVFFNGAGGAPGGTRTWCGDSAGLCDNALGLRFGNLHRSFAWGADQRVIALEDGSYATLEGTSFVRRPSFRHAGRGAAFGAPDEGWLGTSHITRSSRPLPNMRSWPIPVRRPLTAIAGEPGQATGSTGSPALAVGLDGSVLRYSPGQGWDTEPLLGSSGVSQDDLRGVAWPSNEFAFAVGDDGAMWRWRRATGLWESDPGEPFDFEGNLMGVAFQPGNPERGYAVGRQGVLLRYGKSWTPEPLPAGLATAGPGGGPADLTAVAFAGPQALVAAGKSLLVNDGGGWRIDPGAQALLDQTEGEIYAVAGLPDGGAIAAGRGVVIVRDGGPGAPWRLTEQPIVVGGGQQTVAAVGAVREGLSVRAMVALNPSRWPFLEDVELGLPDPDLPPPRPFALNLTPFGNLLRETASGWRDEERMLFSAPGRDGPRKTDPVAGFLLEPSGRGWIVGGWNGLEDGVGVRGQRRDSGNADGPEARNVATASVARYAPAGGAEAPPAPRAPRVATPPGPVRVLLGGHAQCEDPCVQSAQLDLMPDRTPARAVELARTLGAQSNGPRALLYTGGRTASEQGAASTTELARLAQLLGSGATAPPVFGTVAPADSAGGNGAQPFQSAFAGFPRPFGTGPAASGTTPVALGAPPAAGTARTHYAVDLEVTGGRLRIVVIDNSPGSLEAADSYQNPREPQRPWLLAVLADARAKRVPVIVMGNRSLNTGETDLADRPRVATDATATARLLRDEGASAYVYDAFEKQRAGRIPAGDAVTIPSFGSGTLGYRPSNDPLAFGVPGLTMLEVDVADRNRGTNRAPVAPRLIPVIEDLALEALDGRILNRSQPALFRGLGRRPRSGDRWSNSARGSSPYVELPLVPCPGGCAGRLEPEARFTSSDPDIANFVRQDPASTNARKPYVNPTTDKPVADASSGLLCAFNAGTTTVSVESAGLAYSTTVTVRDGSVLRPCGTVALDPRRFAPQRNPGVGVPADSGPDDGQPNPNIEFPVAPAGPAPARNPSPFVRPPALFATPVPIILPLQSASPRPSPPSGTSPVGSTSAVLQPATRVEKERDEEIAPEQQQSAVRYDAGDTRVVGGLVVGLVLCAALAGASLRRRPRGRDRGEQLALSYDRARSRNHWRSE